MPKHSLKKLRGRGRGKVKIGPGKDLIAAIYNPKFLKHLQEQGEKSSHKNK